ncbi:TIGR00725 family protein [Arthrobacter mobilis]|uniref:TIGR00725 family protein n=1 Tax=Arthrobacter mobilis TaxID=2724944 RepID=A0A7X6HBF1_9MICC|nr:TIGR00725 family protein [Arthrobacter mobilis]NKX53058.1 TIGR00725 family protein [Arthrobacter mobilis]
MYAGVVGPGEEAADGECAAAYEVGRLLAQAGAVVVTGGLDGVMAAASRGAFEHGGVTVGILPGADRAAANPYLTVSLPTGMGQLRNALLVRSCDALVAVGGSWGTASEIALACRTGVPVYTIGGWRFDAAGPVPVASAEEAVRRLLAGR